MTTAADLESNIRLFKRELDSWRSFVDALREDDRVVARKLFQKCWKYADAIESSGKPYLVEPFFLSVLLSQEQHIDSLESKLLLLSNEMEAWKSRAGS